MIMDFETLCNVIHPSRYIGGEINSVRKDADSVDLKVALLYPDVYEVGFSHLGLQILYHVVNSRREYLAERAFMPWVDLREILLKVAADSEMVSKDPEPAALFTGFGDSSLNFTLRAWIPEAGDWPQISSDLYEGVEAAISAAGITIPFPQRTLHIESDARTPPRDE